MARTSTSVGTSSGQHGNVPSVPMTTSAACGRPEQQASFTRTIVDVPTFSRCTNPASASSLTWWEQVGWAIPTRLASAPMAVPSPGAVATACSTWTRVGSASVANHAA